MDQPSVVRARLCGRAWTATHRRASLGPDDLRGGITGVPARGAESAEAADAWPQGLPRPDRAVAEPHRRALLVVVEAEPVVDRRQHPAPREELPGLGVRAVPHEQ